MEAIKKAYKDQYKRFQNWQKTPFEVAPMSEEEQTCATCGTEYKGNYCPRCGQSSRIEPRMSAWKTLLMVLDVWGLGNRGMFRTLRDLIFRPGYMICDYLQGRRSAYFPPFKLLFLLTTFSLLVGHGFNILHENYQIEREPFKFTSNNSVEDYDPILEGLSSWINYIFTFQNDYPALFQLCFMGIAGYFFYIFFRKSKILGKISFPEFFIGLVYMVNMYILYISFVRIFGYFGMGKIYWSWIPLLYLIPLKQISGYSLMSTVGRAFCGLILGFIAYGILMLIGIILAVLIFNPD